MKNALPDLSLSQKDKLADFFVNFAVAWFVASVVSQIFTLQELTTDQGLRILTGVGFGSGFLYFSLSLIRDKL